MSFISERLACRDGTDTTVMRHLSAQVPMRSRRSFRTGRSWQVQGASRRRRRVPSKAPANAGPVSRQVRRRRPTPRTHLHCFVRSTCLIPAVVGGVRTRTSRESRVQGILHGPLSSLFPHWFPGVPRQRFKPTGHAERGRRVTPPLSNTHGANRDDEPTIAGMSAAPWSQDEELHRTQGSRGGSASPGVPPPGSGGP